MVLPSMDVLVVDLREMFQHVRCFDRPWPRLSLADESSAQHSFSGG